jgi:phosphoglucomutase
MTRGSVQTVQTTPFSDQRPGTSGLRKKTRIFLQPHYVENFVQSVFDSLREKTDFSKEILAIGGDGRFYNRTAVQTIIRIAAANGIGRIIVGRGGFLSTPAMSALIRRRNALGGILLTASHNPGGIDADFGIKYNIRNGGPAPESFTERIYSETRRIERYLTLESADVDINRESTSVLGNTEITVVDPLADYTEVLKELFDFGAMRALFQSGFRILFDAMHGITGIYARHIFEEILGAPPGTVTRGTPLEDFGGLHPDPNQLHAAELVQRMAVPDAPDLGAACDGDGDRNMILSPGFFVTPGDSLALIAEHAGECLPGYSSGLAGVARSMPTSTAVDRVAARLGIPCHETPTGWKFFGNLMDAGKCTICGEESFGTGSDHVREKDGLWAVLAWIGILAVRRASVSRLIRDHWQKFGRSYYQRHDYEQLEANAANEVISELREGIGKRVGSSIASTTVVQADDFQYTDPVDGSVSARQGIRIILADGSRIVGRLSGTGTEGATLRLYFERYRNSGEESLEEMLKPLVDAARELFQLRKRFNRDHPTVIT